MRRVNVLVVRTEMIGGGTAYDVYVPKAAKGQYRPIAYSCYATQHYLADHPIDEAFYKLDDFLRSPELDDLPALSDERLNAFNRLHRICERFEAVIAARAFPELRGCRKLPGLWASWSLPSAERIVKVNLPAEWSVKS